jgi:hypothetical protein
VVAAVRAISRAMVRNAVIRLREFPAPLAGADERAAPLAVPEREARHVLVLGVRRRIVRAVARRALQFSTPKLVRTRP